MGVIAGWIRAGLDRVEGADGAELVVLVAMALATLLLARRMMRSPMRGDEGADEEHPVARTSGVPMVPLRFTSRSEAEIVERANTFYKEINQRRSVRTFSSRNIPNSVIENVIMAASSAPSGAHTQPWFFVAIRTAEMKRSIREAVEREEKENYERRMGAKWVEDLKPFGTSWSKPYLETAPVLIVMFKQPYGKAADGSKVTHYYHEISSGIAAGLLVAAVHQAGLCTLTSTPLNTGPALRALLGRPSHEKVLLLLPVGYPADDATVPALTRKSLPQVMQWR